MNDFTKYELQSLLWAIEYVRDRTNNCGDVMRATKLKIQSMIDNYCEHEYENDFGKDSRPRFQKALNPKCKKCGKLFTNNQQNLRL